MSSKSNVQAAAPRSNTKIALSALFAIATVFVVYAKNSQIFDPSSPIAQHFAPAKAFLIPHAIFASIALVLGIFQFSNRLRARYLNVHKTLGYIYIVAVVIGGPSGILIALTIGPKELFMASVVQSFGWIVTTAIALYCVRTGNITQHRRWMIRSYPFGAVFTVARLFVPLGLKLAGDAGLVQVVWTSIAMAAFLPSLLLEWQQIVARKPKSRTAAAA
jgi:uncharacterized membrane protein